MCCTECGMTNRDHKAKHGRQLEVHRIEPGSAYSVSGCVTLCRSCHGPKPKSESAAERLDTFFQFSCSKHQKERVAFGAAKRGLKPAAFIRMVLYDRLNADSVPMPPKSKPPKK